MSVPPESIEVGKCYLARSQGSPRLCRVVKVMFDGRILYDQRTRLRTWSVVQERQAFARILEREVPCDWTPEMDG